MKVLHKIRALLILSEFSWNFKDADDYRRRPFPLKFLQNECSPFPCYVFQSALSKAFDSENAINSEIDVSEFNPDLQNPIVHHSESLVTSTKEFIRNIFRIVKERLNFSIVINPGNKLILKVHGCREYLDGNYQLLQYERVRLCLRKKSVMKLILTQIPIDYQSKFPPLFKPSANSKDVFSLTPHIDPNDLTNYYPYFWHSPVPQLQQKFGEKKQIPSLHTQNEHSDAFQLDYEKDDDNFISL